MGDGERKQQGGKKKKKKKRGAKHEQCALLLNCPTIKHVTMLE
jgi:hypothetical protein